MATNQISTINRLTFSKIIIHKTSLKNDIEAMRFCMTLASNLQNGTTKDANKLFNYYKSIGNMENQEQDSYEREQGFSVEENPYAPNIQN